jgi:hypothetical protein
MHTDQNVRDGIISLDNSLLLMCQGILLERWSAGFAREGFRE